MRLALVFLVLLGGCGRTAQDRASFPVHAAGTGETAFEHEGWTVTLERADVALGPVYLCATPFADLDQCPRAEAEWLGTATVDALDEAPQMLGEADAITATVRSSMLDFGRSWLITEAAPRASEGAPEGRSAVMIARAAREDVELEVRASVDVDPAFAGQSAAFGVPTGVHAITGEEALTIRVDPAAWWRRVDFDRLAAADDGDGIVELAPGDRAYDALVIAMTAGTLPRFEWAQP